jgi:hypothetical protein
VAVIDAQASSVLALGDHPGLRGWAVLEPGDAHATLLREENDPCEARTSENPIQAKFAELLF